MTGAGSSIREEAARIGADVSAPAADSVDSDARFPSESFEALREAGLLAALVPVELGGRGATIVEVAEACEALGRHCASTGLIFAMHQIQVDCLVRHGRNPALRAFTRQVAEEGLLLASATTEKGIGGDVRSSSCAVERDGERYSLVKDAPVISYGQHADAILATARSNPDAPASDQVLVVCRKADVELEPTGSWDTLGFRGTCSLGFLLKASGAATEVLDDAYSDISSRTMLPTSHVLWSSVWLGIASAAVSKARSYVRAEARKKVGTIPPAATRLAELVAVHQQLVDAVHGARNGYHDARDDDTALTSMAFAIEMNGLKVAASMMTIEIVNRALAVCGMAGYRQDSPHTLGRLLRDAHGAQLMINNDRILGHNAQMLLVSKEER